MERKSIALLMLAIVAILGATMAAGCTTSDTAAKTYNDSNNNSTVTVKGGETFNISLAENPTTGYSWNVSVTSGLSIVNDTYLPSNTSLVGAGGLRVWQLKATGTGDQEFNAIYKRSWEPLFGNETTYRLAVKIA